MLVKGGQANCWILQSDTQGIWFLVQDHTITTCLKCLLGLHRRGQQWLHCVPLLYLQRGWAGVLLSIGKSPRWGFLDHAFMHNFTPTAWASGGSVAHHWPRLQRARSLSAFNVTLLILVLEIPFNFQFDMRCAGNVSFQVNASFEQILFP